MLPLLAGHALVKQKRVSETLIAFEFTSAATLEGIREELGHVRNLSHVRHGTEMPLAVCAHLRQCRIANLESFGFRR